ncbi:UNVERIFIED_CONTAM: hypothetical protein PYX00_007138 [Menopon gallinae]|uniref:Sema domain-containing protein n=1 Tax=Menopon gallinae TaxID=328185 RepID=A0AAW2HHK8_9NEOP
MSFPRTGFHRSGQAGRATAAAPERIRGLFGAGQGDHCYSRDSIFRLSLTDLRMLEKAPWFAPNEKIQLCQDKGQSDNDCHNFIKVLLSNGKRLFTCGTNAFAPECTWREIENVNKVIEWVPGVAKSPYSPHANITALMTARGQYFVGSPTDFSGTDSAITRTDGHPTSQSLRTNQYNSKWLNEPHFVGSFETDKFVFFLFREAAVEYINCGKIIYSRIARVCKNDEGGQLLLKDNWTTFLKARLNCSLPGDYPFYFDEIQGMAYNEEEKVIYATFTTPSNSIPGSAICSFNISAIEDAFSGPFKHQSNPGAAWEKDYSQNRNHFECELASASHSHLIDSSRYQLMDSAVQPATPKPLYNSNMETLVHIAIDVLSTKLHNRVHLLYVSTSDGRIKKISVLPRTKETCVVEVWNPSPMEHPVQIRTLQYLKETDSVYVGMETGVLRIPTNHCQRHKTKAACHNAMDPHCGWNELLLQCTTAPNRNPLTMHWLQSVTECPLLHVPVDGGWSSWSNWFSCSLQGTQTTEDNGDRCKCRTRQCNNPTPQNGGAPCSGISVAVTNCTVHGAWTMWSAWSKCTQSCGMAVKTRYRTCGNPEPAHGGRVCVGQSVDETYCQSNPPCPLQTPPPRDGEWSEWSNWGDCSAPCGGGFRSRRRTCDNPEGGQDCNGCHMEYETCNTHGCAEGKKTGWTPWIPVGNVTSRNGYVEKRFKFLCKAPIQDPNLMKMSQPKEEERFCYNSGSCSKSAKSIDPEDSSEWSPWSPCTKSCGGGVQERTRVCTGNCDETFESRACNTHSCSGDWGCWSEWTECSVTCGNGRQTRTRVCLLGENGQCEGSTSEYKRCEKQSCHSLQGWDNWSVWSPCDSKDEQYRVRKCLTSNPGPQICQGPDLETRSCFLGKDADIGCVGVAVAKSYAGVGVVLGCSVAAFLMGLLAAVAYMYYCQKRRRVRIPGSPHYISSKQNPYVTIPLRETPKRTPSSCSNGSNQKSASNGNGILPSKMFSKPAEYETATIKRNSHSLANGHAVRAQLDEDKFF